MAPFKGTYTKPYLFSGFCINRATSILYIVFNLYILWLVFNDFFLSLVVLRLFSISRAMGYNIGP